MSERVHITGFPMPPSGNNLYATIGKRRVKSGGYKAFERNASVWAMIHQPQLQAARELCTKVRVGVVINITQLFFFPKEAILCKDGSPKRNDTSNRLKALHDALASLLHIDDSWFWSGAFDKTSMTVGNTVGNPEYLENGFVDISLELRARPFA